MCLFTTQLQRIFDDTVLTRIELARKTGIRYATLSNYATGRSTPDSEAMQAICGILEAQDAAALAEAWLRDLSGGLLEKLVRVERREAVAEDKEQKTEARGQKAEDRGRRAEGDAEAGGAGYSALNRQQHNAMYKLAQAVIRHTEWEMLLYAMTDVLPSENRGQRAKGGGERKPTKNI